jgi:hypothetical protein
MDELARRYHDLGAQSGIDIVTAREGLVLAIGRPA